MSGKCAPIEERFWRYVEPEPNSGCWLWTGAWAGERYPVLGRGGQFGSNYYAHRLSYEMFRGQIPTGLTIDHLCRVRCCVNPQHLEAVSQRENVLRGESTAAQRAKQTACKRGHPFTPENTWVSKHGWRYCKTCNRLAKRGAI